MLILIEEAVTGLKCAIEYVVHLTLSVVRDGSHLAPSRGQVYYSSEVVSSHECVVLVDLLNIWYLILVICPPLVANEEHVCGFWIRNCLLLSYTSIYHSVIIALPARYYGCAMIHCASDIEIGRWLTSKDQNYAKCNDIANVDYKGKYASCRQYTW